MQVAQGDETISETNHNAAILSDGTHIKNNKYTFLKILTD